ncbi:hypothetical protein ACFO3U_07050 [Flavobacterium ponti]|uniref:DUF3592 domain-containing protein n=1 Tax=Flavobacterium ponti TaxID=665133 RepID=A0ABV9P4E0_9FLAO
MKYYFKQQFVLSLFFFSILLLLTYKKYKYEKVSSNENLVEAILIDKNCDYKLGLKTSNKNMSSISVKYSDSIYNLDLDYKFCDSLKIYQKMKLYIDKENDELYLKNNTNFNSLIYFLIILIILTLIPYKLLKK